MSDKNDLFDRHFIFRAITLVIISIGAAMLVRAIAGDGAAGIAMIGLAAVLAKIFEKSETLQIQLQPETPPAIVSLTALEPWRLIVIACCFMGVTLLLGDISDWVIFKFVPRPNNVHPIYTPWGFTIGVSIMCIAYYVSGYIATRSSISIRFAYVLWAAVIDIIVTHWAYTLIRQLVQDPSEFSAFVLDWLMVTWVLYVTFALIGARAGMRSVTRISGTSIETATELPPLSKGDPLPDVPAEPAPQSPVI